MQFVWINSTPGPNQRPLAHTRIDARTDPSLPFAAIGSAPAGTQVLPVDPSIAPGNWEARAVEVDIAGVEATSQPTITFTIAAPIQAPTGVTGFAFQP